MIISVVAAKIWYLKNVQFLLGHPVLHVNKYSQISNSWVGFGSNQIVTNYWFDSKFHTALFIIISHHSCSRKL